jgi:hypothetical protein
MAAFGNGLRLGSRQRRRNSHLAIIQSDPFCADGVGARAERWGRSESCYSQRNTFADSAVHTINTPASAAKSPRCADQVSPFQMPASSDTV